MSVKPLLKKDLSAFLKRFDGFKDAELRSIEIISPTIVKITLAVQDSAREFDWITIKLELSEIIDARLLENSKLPHVDMSVGILSGVPAVFGPERSRRRPARWQTGRIQGAPSQGAHPTGASCLAKDPIQIQVPLMPIRVERHLVRQPGAR